MPTLEPTPTPLAPTPTPFTAGSDVGSKGHPAPIGATGRVVREEGGGVPSIVLEATVDWAVRGESATRTVRQAHPLNPAPSPAEEYITVKLTLRYPDGGSGPGVRIPFESVVLMAKGEGSPPEFVRGISPVLPVTLHPGSTREALVMFLVPKDEDAPLFGLGAARLGTRTVRFDEPAWWTLEEAPG